MKTSNVAASFVLIIVISCINLAQEKPKAELVYEFEKINCEELSASIDLLYNRLQADPSAAGYILINNLGDDIFESLRYPDYIRGVIRFRSFDANRLKIIRFSSSEAFRAQYWYVPNGAELILSRPEWNLKLSGVTKPMRFWGPFDFGEVCDSSDFYEEFAELLLANPKLNGLFEIHEETLNRFKKTARELKIKFVKVYKVPEKQLRFYFAKGTPSYQAGLWLIPKKK